VWPGLLAASRADALVGHSLVKSAVSPKKMATPAAARNQANTARLLAENPILARLKELEMLQKILARSKPTFVFGNTNLLEQMRSLTGTPVGS
jgi:hypothetical protein